MKARLINRSMFWNPDIQKAVIKATSHDESYVDLYHTQSVYAWIYISDDHFRPLLWALSDRMERTHNWVVALKGLMLMHGIFCCKIPAIQTIGRLPFDLSGFKHGRFGNLKRWSFEAFIRDYYAFLNHKSLFLHLLSQQPKDDQEKSEKCRILQDLVLLQKLQRLFNTLLQIKPQYAASKNLLVLDAMEAIVAEGFDIYSRICDGIVSILDRISSDDIIEAKITLSVIEMAMAQGEKLSKYLDFCRSIGVVKASEFPEVECIPKAHIYTLENLIKSASNQSRNIQFLPKEEQKYVIIKESKQFLPKEDQKHVIIKENKQFLPKEEQNHVIIKESKQFLPKEEQKHVIIKEKTTTESRGFNNSSSGLRMLITDWEIDL